MNNLDDIADQLDGDLGAAALLPLHRRNKSSPGKTAGLTMRRKVEFVVQAIKKGRPDSATALACLAGSDGAELRHRVWLRARTNPAVALFLTDAWKREAEAYVPSKKP